MKIIIADDSTFVRNIVLKAISTHFPQAQITQCKNGLEALEAYNNEAPDWLITDLLMPEMSGQELLGTLQKQGKIGKHIVISADIQKGTRDEIEDFGVVAFINKPLTPDKIALLIEQLKGE